MRRLDQGTNIDADSTNYPDGRARNKSAGIDGTITNEELMGDIIQLFFSKLPRDAGITINGNPDNVSNGYQMLEALNDKIKSTMGIVDITTAVSSISTGTINTKTVDKYSKVYFNASIQIDMNVDVGTVSTPVDITINGVLPGGVSGERIACEVNGVAAECKVSGLTPLKLQIPAGAFTNNTDNDIVIYGNLIG